MKLSRFTRVLALFVMVALGVFMASGCVPAATTEDGAATASAAGGGISMIIMLVLMIGVFYFLMIRPENKRKKQAQQMRDNLAVGDTVTTIGGIMGKVVNVRENAIVIETSDDRVRLQLMKWAVSSVGKQTEEPKE